MLKFVRTGRKETSYSAGLHPVIKAGLRAGKGEHTVFVPFRLESINTQHNIGVLVSGNGYSHGIVVTDPTKEGKKFKITSNVDRYNIYINGAKYDGRELDFGQIYTLSFSAELGTLVHLGASKLVSADFYQGIKIFSERRVDDTEIEGEHISWLTKYGEEKTKTLAAIEAAKLNPVKPSPVTPSPVTPVTPENPKQDDRAIRNNDINSLEINEKEKLGIYTFNYNGAYGGLTTITADNSETLRINIVESNPPVVNYSLFNSTDGEENSNASGQTSPATSETGTPPAAENKPEGSGEQNTPATEQPNSGTGTNTPSSENAQPGSSSGTEVSPPVANTSETGSETAKEETVAEKEAKGIYTLNLKNATEESVKSDGEGLTVRAVYSSTPVNGYKLLVKEEQQ
jgi:hypothetical protein